MLLAANNQAAGCCQICAHGATVRKTIDTMIATRCIESGFALPSGGFRLLYSDQDFDPFVEHLGLISALTNK